MILFIIGALFAAGLNIYDIENHYDATITAPAGVAWSLWIPRPEVALSFSVTGSLNSIAQVDTVHGVMDNVTGEGSVRLSGSLNRGGVGFLDDHDAISEGFINISGRESMWKYWVWRWSSDPQTNVSVHASLWFKGGSMRWDFNCGGPGYDGEVSEGWNQVDALVGGCNALLPDVNYLLGWILMMLGAVGVSISIYLGNITQRQRSRERTPVDTDSNLAERQK